MADKIMKNSIKRREQLCHKYSLVGFLIFPNPTIIKEASEKKTEDNKEAFTKLIDKLFLETYLIGGEISEEISNLIQKLWNEYGYYTL